MWRRRPKLTLPPPLLEGSRDLQYANQPGALTPANRVTSLRSGEETFPSMLAAIESAREYVHLETYIYRSDRTGRVFGQALAERARNGVAVRLMMDAVGSLGIDATFLADLRGAGVDIVIFRPLTAWHHRWRVTQRDHRKILVVDGRVGFTGGLNIADDYASASEGGGGWLDLHVRVEGPAVADLARLFRRTWIAAGGPAFETGEQPSQEAVVGDDSALAVAIGTDALRKRMAIRRAYLHAMKQARKTIRILNAYFIPDRGLRRAMVNAARRGVDVKVLVPGRSDVVAAQLAGRHLFASLLRGGVRIFEWPEMMHAKAAVVDEVWAVIGSYNIDARSVFHNLEVVLCIVDRDFGRGLHEDLDREFAASRELQLATWSRRSWWDKLVEWFWFQFRYWL